MSDPGHKPSWSLDEAIDSACLRFEAAWKAGLRPALADYVEPVPREERAAFLRQLLPLDRHYRAQQGEHPSPELYLAQFPQEAAVIREVFPGCTDVVLKVTKGPHRGKTFTLKEHGTFIVGRSDRAHLRLETKDRYVSRVHFLIEANPPLCQLMDLDSRGGTWVNGQRVTRSDLKHGDVIRAGHTLIRVEFVEAAEPEKDPEETIFWPQAPAAPELAKPSAPPPFRRQIQGSEVCLCCRKQGGTLQDQICRACRENAQQQDQPIPGYLLLRELGSGGMGIVHLALWQADGMIVAIKRIKPVVAADPRNRKRFLREAGILKTLDHRHIVRYLDMGQARGQLYFVMDCIDGTSASELLRQRGPFSVRKAVGVVDQLLRALEYAHGQKKIVHRDVKPANLLIQNLPGKKTKKMVKVADFGLARVYQASGLSGLTFSGEMGGTTGFLAPEQITSFREAQPPADQYAAAASLYNLLTGKHIYDFPEPLEARIAMILNERPMPIQERRPELPHGLAEVIHRALAREPEDRFPGVAAFRKALMPFLSFS